MKTENELNTEILKITTIIREKYPELLKYLTELQDTIPTVTHPEINNEILQEYYNSLEAIMKKYAQNHQT